MLRTAVTCSLIALCGCTGELVTPQDDAQLQDSAWGPRLPQDVEPPTVRVRRLSAREYNNVVADLLGDTTQPAKHFPPETYTIGFDNGSVDLSIQTDQLTAYQTAAETLAARAVSDQLPSLLNGCDVAQSSAASCRDAFLSSFVRRAFRRPPTSDELSRLRGVFDSANTLAGFNVALQTTLEAVLLSPAFLYREELGGQPGADGRTLLKPFEFASALSFLLTGSMPDDALLAAAEEGRLRTPEDVEREGQRLLALPRSKANLRAFLHQWLATHRLQALAKDSALYPMFSDQLAADMRTELDQFIDDVLFERSGSLRELFTSNTSFVNAGLSSLYGQGAGRTAFTRTELDPTLRRGVMTRAGFLAVHSAPDHSSPIERGVFVRQAFLCAPLPPPPPDVIMNVTPPDASSTLTTRQRFLQHENDPSCSGCHQIIDGIGFGFEEFDAVGTHRTTENGQPVDPSGALLNTRDVDGPFRGVSELADRLVSSRQFAECAVTHALRFALGSGEAPNTGLALADVNGTFSAEARLSQLLVSLASQRLFIERRVEAPGP